MGDRLDIDALLIGALYGELDGDDRARLDAHLASHPADRATLDGLRSTRALLVDHGAREFLGAAEPPSAISARLIQEAARRAPAPRIAAGGVFGFLAGLFRPIAAHPAMSAAAAMLIVIGAGTLMMRRGTLEVVQPPAPTVSSAAPAIAPPPPVQAAPGAADGYAVTLDERGPAAAADEGRAQGAEVEGLTAKLDGRALKKERESAKDATRAAKPTGGTGSTGVARGAATKGADNAFLEVDKAARGENVALRNAEDGDGAPANESVATGAAAPVGKQAIASGGGGLAQPPADAPTAAVPKRSTDDAMLAWARDQHARMVKLVNQGRCTDAGQIGAEIARKAPDYYASAVANDRAVRSCKAYVDQARRAKQPAKAKNVATEPDSPLEDSVNSK
ncbi:MAG: zf-HC2 domain-containing protein [Myxococcales bacterium]|nr:zf-HC2 domain-containing protein [Myxococcales bacterium]